MSTFTTPLNSEKMQQEIINKLEHYPHDCIFLPECAELEMKDSEGESIYPDRIINVGKSVWVYCDYECMAFNEMPEKEQKQIFDFIMKY